MEEMMNYISKLFVAAAMLVASSSFAATPADAVLMHLQKAVTMSAASNLNWKVGDVLNLSIDVANFLKGTAKVEVTKDEAEGFTLVQNIELAGQKQVVEAVIDKDTGQIKKYKVNGQDQPPPDTSGTKLIKQEQAHITVPAGSYDCIHIVMEDAQKQQSEAWINPMAVPIIGLLKQTATAQGMPVVMELTSFARGH